MRKLAFTRPSVPSAPKIITATRIYALDENGSTPDAFLIIGDRIRCVGTVNECRATAAAISAIDVKLVDLGDATVVPGFIDAHAHPLMLGQMMSWVDCGPDKAGSIPEIVALLSEAATRLPVGRPIRGYGYEQRNLAERRHPTRCELDQVSTDREVYLMNASGHGGVVNSYTFELCGITRDTPDPKGGQFFRDASGDLTGELSDAACNVLTGLKGVKIGHHGPNFHLADEPEEHKRQLAAAQESFLQGGVTTVGDAQVSRREFDMYLRLAEDGDLKMRVSMYLLSHLLDEVIEMGMHGQFGNEHLSFAGIKFYSDGTLGGWTAYFPDGYAGDPCRTGQLYHEPREYTELVAKAHRVGLQTATHSQSPTALEMVISAIEAAQAERPDPDARHRIEHCGLPTPEQITRMATASIMPVSQPQHHYNWGEGVEQAIGTPGERFNPLGEFERAGVPVTISSDAPVADPRPMEAIQASVSRITRRGNQLGSADLTVSLDTALRAHTISGARALGREDELGSIEVGKRADFTALERDPHATLIPDLASIGVTETWIGGERMYAR